MKDILKSIFAYPLSDVLVPEPVLWLPHQFQVLANPILLILALIVSFLAV